MLYSVVLYLEYGSKKWETKEKKQDQHYDH